MAQLSRPLGAPIAASIVAVGARATLGQSALQLAMCARARTLVPHTLPLRDRRGHGVGACAAWGVPSDLLGYERLLALGAPALREAGAELTAPVPVLLALPAPGRADDDARLDTRLLADLGDRSGVAVDVERSLLFRVGQAGFASALGEGLRRIRAGEARVVLVGGLDSYLHPDVLRALDHDRRLHAPGAEDGFIPGEGAAFALLCREPADVAVIGKPPPVALAHLLEVVVGREETEVSSEPNLAATMTALVERLASTLPGGRLDWVLNDVNGERHRVREWTMVAGRGSLHPGATQSRLIDDVSDLGAALGPALLAVAACSFRAGCAPAPTVAITLASEGPERGAFLLEAAPPAPPSLAAGGAPRGARARSPAAHLASAERDTVEQTLLRLADLPPKVDRAPLVAAAERAVTALTALGASDVDDPAHLDVVEAAIAAIAGLREAHTGIAGAAAAASTGELTRAEEALRGARPTTIDAVVAVQDEQKRRASSDGALREAPLLASRGVPQLHRLPTGLVPALQYDADEDNDDDEDDDDDDDAPPRPPALPRAPSPAELRECARQCAEDIGMLSVLRAAEGDEPWSSGALRFEQRMLDSLDALASLAGPVVAQDREGRWSSNHFDALAEVSLWSSDGAIPDPSRAFAAIFLLACVEGEAAIRAAVLLVRKAPPALHPAMAEALILGASPAIGEAMRRLSTGDEPALARLALDVLHRRREPSFAAAAMLLDHPDASVRESAARCLGLAAEKAAAIALLEEALAPDEDPRVATAAAESLLLLGAPAGLAFLRKSLRDELSRTDALPDRARFDQLRLLALAGGPADGDLLLRSFRGHPEEVSAMGWLGHAGLVEPLLEVLDRASLRSPDEVSTLEIATAHALHRITGAPLFHPPSEDDLDPDAGTILTDPTPWKAWWAEHKGAFGGQKVRFGQPFSAMISLDELRTEGVATDIRHTCALELTLLSGGAVPLLDVRGWSAHQIEQLDALHASLSKDRRGRPSLGTPGEWPERVLEGRR